MGFLDGGNHDASICYIGFCHETIAIERLHYHHVDFGLLSASVSRFLTYLSNFTGFSSLGSKRALPPFETVAPDMQGSLKEKKNFSLILLGHIILEGIFI